MNGLLVDLVHCPAPILILAPHPDDESLGCGLLLAERWRWGRPTHIACLTDGAASHSASRVWPGPRLAALRREELSSAIRFLGGDPARDVTWLGHPDAALHRLQAPGGDLVRDVLRLVDRLGAWVLLTTSPEDPHCDHVTCADAAGRVARLRTDLQLWSYPVWSRWHGWAAGREASGARLDLPEQRVAKRAAIHAHRSQMGLVVRDDPEGFAMPPGFADRFCAEAEVFVPVQP